MRIKPDFPSCEPIACVFSRAKKNEHEVFAPRVRRRRKPENPVVKKGERSEPPPKIYYVKWFSSFSLVRFPSKINLEEENEEEEEFLGDLKHARRFLMRRTDSFSRSMYRHIEKAGLRARHGAE